MRASWIVELQIAADRSACIADAVIGSQIYLLVFDGASQPLDEHIIPPGSAPVHAEVAAPILDGVHELL